MFNSIRKIFTGTSIKNDLYQVVELLKNDSKFEYSVEPKDNKIVIGDTHFTISCACRKVKENCFDIIPDNQNLWACRVHSNGSTLGGMDRVCWRWFSDLRVMEEAKNPHEES